ncbi:PH domain-containing protein [Modestobacter sp. NPDC049651]|uniref:PH domain-containing protein n=1 Tax=unclassified Modestobacter TaxID=2643866 RepID=UPI0033E334DF
MQWSPRTGETVAFAVIGLALALATLLVDEVGKVLVGAAALLVLALAARDAVLRPRLATGPGGVTVRTLGGSTSIAWPLLQVRVRTSRRWGLVARTLELGDRADDAVLLVLGRRDLGADPEAVARRLTADAAAGGQPTA